MEDVNKYQRGKIYKIVCNKTNLVYIGSTIEHYLTNRLKRHRLDYKKHLNGKHRFTTSFDILKNDDYYIELIELFPCNSKDELLVRERHYFDIIECVNKVKPKSTNDEKKEVRVNSEIRCKDNRKKYREDNRDKILEKNKIRYEANKEEASLRNRIYRENNKDKIKDISKKYYEENKDLHKAKAKEYTENNKDLISIKGKKYYNENKEAIKEYQREYIEKNKELIKAKKREYYQNNKDKWKKKSTDMLQQQYVKMDS